MFYLTARRLSHKNVAKVTLVFTATSTETCRRKPSYSPNSGRCRAPESQDQSETILAVRLRYHYYSYIYQGGTSEYSLAQKDRGSCLSAARPLVRMRQ